MDIPPDLPDGWHQIPGDDKEDGKRQGILAGAFRFFWFVKIVNGVAVALSSSNQIDHVKHKSSSGPYDSEEIIQAWGVELASLFEKEEDLAEKWADDFVVGE